MDLQTVCNNVLTEITSLLPEADRARLNRTCWTMNRRLPMREPHFLELKPSDVPPPSCLSCDLNEDHVLDPCEGPNHVDLNVPFETLALHQRAGVSYYGPAYDVTCPSCEISTEDLDRDDYDDDCVPEVTVCGLCRCAQVVRWWPTSPGYSPTSPGYDPNPGWGDWVDNLPFSPCSTPTHPLINA